MNSKTPLIDQINSFDSFGRFVYEDYDHKRPFSSFLPGIAGLHGIPMWVFYVNRGQSVCSFGVENKDHPILEFQAANKAYRLTGLTGFRTFLKGIREAKNWKREAFSPWGAKDVQRTMFIGMNEVEIQEVNTLLGYQVNVLYFMLPNLPFSGLVRRVSIKNLQDSPLQLEILDGLPGIVPYGVDNGALKHISRTIEAWMQVVNIEQKIPYYRLKATPGDTAAVHTIDDGNYALAFGSGNLLSPIADPMVIFGLDSSHSEPHNFYDQGLKDILAAQQTLEGRSLCAFFGDNLVLAPREEQTLLSLYGYAQSISAIQSRADLLQADGFIDQKLAEARKLTWALTNDIRTDSGSLTFDYYCRQTFLDNLVRGGYPLGLGEENITHVYSRKHGDIERDYNYFVIPPEYYSQGNGNYRDVNQNRRNDVFFVPKAGEFNIRMFMSLIQADGYNPLVINGLTYSLPSDHQKNLLTYAHDQGELAGILKRRFTPGDLYKAAIKADISISADQFLEKVFSKAEAHIEAVHGEGYWIDHWTYNLDLIESFLSIYPDEKENLLFHSDPLPFYDNTVVVQPRNARFVSYHGKPRQLNAVSVDPEKVALISSRVSDPNWARDEHGKGDIFRLPLVSKLTLLAVIKFATLDPAGMGIQMEAGKPGWYDALNGLPGLFGSSMPETYELKRLVNFLMETLEEDHQEALLPIEAQVLTNAIEESVGHEDDAFKLWDKTTTALEGYRDSTRLGFDGRTISVDLQGILTLMCECLEKGIAKAQTYLPGIPPTYFIYEASEFSVSGGSDAAGHPYIQVENFEPVVLPAFLEGPVRLMKISDQPSARELARSVKVSALFDRELEMYKVNAPLKEQSHEIGRARAFTPGWLENESIWMHMAFKYLLELQRAELYEQFFDALKHHLPVFMDPNIYGRSPLENSSFIVSSAHPDSELHGNGFVARLSGSTAEFLSMWTLMTAGKNPFRLVEGQLALALNPKLPGWIFDQDGKFTFRFLGSCDVTLHNPECLDTYAEGLVIKNIELRSDTESFGIDGAVIKSPYAEQVRTGEFDRIDIYY